MIGDTRPLEKELHQMIGKGLTDSSYKILNKINLKLKGTLKVFDDFKNKQQKCVKYCFLICKRIYILKVYSIHDPLR